MQSKGIYLTFSRSLFSTYFCGSIHCRLYNQVRKYWEQSPLAVIMMLAILTRLVAVIFSKGWGMHDDHFLVIEASQSWVDGYDYNKWLPGSSGNTGPTGHSFFYVGLHYLLFLLMKTLGMTDPQSKMYVIRLIHAAFSLLTVYFGYRIALKEGGRKAASAAGLLLALLWFMPFLSVRNLVEVACIPFLIWSIWLILKIKPGQAGFMNFFLAGLLGGLAFSVRFQTLMFSAGIGLALLLNRKWKGAFIFGTGLLLSVALIQGVVDSFIWGYPFAEVTAYINYNVEHAYTYFVAGWYMYILLILGILIPPVSLFLVTGFIRNWRKRLLLFLPSLIFIVFHSAFPNKQERFILPAIPFLVILGIIGWQELVQRYSLEKNRIIRGCWIFFWIVNLLLLPFTTTTYSKKARAESMTYLSQYKDIKVLLLEDTNNDEAKMCPRFYLGQWVHEVFVTKKYPLEKLNPIEVTMEEHIPRFFLFFGSENIGDRVAALKEVYPSMEFETRVEPGLLDRFICWLNPINANQTIFIYRNGDFIHP